MRVHKAMVYEILLIKPRRVVVNVFLYWFRKIGHRCAHNGD